METITIKCHYGMRYMETTVKTVEEAKQLKAELQAQTKGGCDRFVFKATKADGSKAF